MKTEWWLSLSILAASVAMSQTERAVTFSSPGERAAVALPKLGRLMGLDLEAAPSTADDVLVIRMEKASRSEVLAKLSSTLDAEWQRQDGVMLLNRTRTQERRQREAELRERAEAFKRGQLRLKAQMEKLGAFDASASSKLAEELLYHYQNPVGRPDSERNAKVERAIAEREPPTRALEQLIVSLPPEELASLTPGVKTAWATRPTLLQRPLGEQAATIVQQAIDAEITWKQAEISTAGLEQNPDQAQAQLHRLLSLRQAPPGSIRLLLTAFQAAHKSEVQFEMILVDSAEKPIMYATKSLEGDLPAELVGVGTSPQPGDALLRLSPARASLLSDLHRLFASNGKATGELKALLLYPEEHDPATLFVGPALVSAAEAKQMNLVALVSDDAWYLGASMDPIKPFGADQIFAELAAIDSVSREGGWLTAKPLEPAWSRHVRTDRSVLGTYARAYAHLEKPTLDEFAEWAAASPSPDDNPLPDILRLATHFQPDETNDRNLLRLYGSFTPEQRAAARAGRPIPVGDLNAVGIDAFNHLMFGSRSSMIKFRLTPGNFQVSSDDYTGLGSEPTQVLGDGLSAQASIRIKPQGKLVFMVNHPRRGGKSAAQPVAVETFAFGVFVHQNPNLFANADLGAATFDLSDLRFGQSEQLEFSFDLAPDVSVYSMVLQGFGLTGEEQSSYEGLPPDIRAKVDQLTAMYKAQYVPTEKSSSGTPPPR